jgi:hypothetical protein
MVSTFRLVALASVSILATGCVPAASLLKTWSAGQTGCVPDTIEVTDSKAVVGGVMWNATCNGKKYLCTNLGTGTNSDQVSCAVAAH